MTGLQFDRRSLLVSAIAVAAGLTLPRAVRAHGVVTLDQARQIIGDRHKQFVLEGADRQMTAPEIAELVTGNTIYGVLYDDEPYVLAFRPDGSGALKIADRPLDTGRWWIDQGADTITSQWEFASGGEALVQDYHATGEAGVYKTITQPRNRWSMFLMEEGIAPDMA